MKLIDSIFKKNHLTHECQIGISEKTNLRQPKTKIFKFLFSNYPSKLATTKI